MNSENLCAGFNAHFAKAWRETLPPADSAAKCLAKCKSVCQRKPTMPKCRARGGIGGQVFGDVLMRLQDRSSFKVSLPSEFQFPVDVAVPSILSRNVLATGLVCLLLGSRQFPQDILEAGSFVGLENRELYYREQIIRCIGYDLEGQVLFYFSTSGSGRLLECFGIILQFPYPHVARHRDRNMCRFFLS